ncbi:hypothetical protein [Methanoregula sp.]|uniref:hypothetical protein n=1 Tax=Methanoregula sp. TaxID=2052170 RepID=UPI003C25BAB2
MDSIPLSPPRLVGFSISRCRAPHDPRPRPQPRRRRGCGVARTTRIRAVRAQEKAGLVECRTPDEKMDRIYRTTGIGAVMGMCGVICIESPASISTDHP